MATGAVPSSGALPDGSAATRAWKRRHRRTRCTAKKVLWVLGLEQSLRSHHTSQQGPGPLRGRGAEGFAVDVGTQTGDCQGPPAKATAEVAVQTEGLPAAPPPVAAVPAVPARRLRSELSEPSVSSADEGGSGEELAVSVVLPPVFTVLPGPPAPGRTRREPSPKKARTNPGEGAQAAAAGNFTIDDVCVGSFFRKGPCVHYISHYHWRDGWRLSRMDRSAEHGVVISNAGCFVAGARLVDMVKSGELVLMVDPSSGGLVTYAQLVDMVRDGELGLG